MVAIILTFLVAICSVQVNGQVVDAIDYQDVMLQALPNIISPTNNMMGKIISTTSLQEDIHDSILANFKTSYLYCLNEAN